MGRDAAVSVGFYCDQCRKIRKVEEHDRSSRPTCRRCGQQLRRVKRKAREPVPASAATAQRVAESVGTSTKRGLSYALREGAAAAVAVESYTTRLIESAEKAINQTVAEKTVAPKPQTREADSRPWWYAWLDPGSLVCVPILAGFFGACSLALVMATATIVTSVDEPEKYRTFYNMLYGGVLLFCTIPTGYFCLQLSRILRAWAGTDQQDPRWGEFDVGNVFRNLLLWLVAAASTALWALPVLWLISWLPLFQWLLTVLLIIPAGVYFSMGLLGALILEHPSGSKPSFVLHLLSQLQQPLGAYATEMAIYVVGLATTWWIAWVIATYTYFFGFFLFVLWWTATMLLACRLARCLGMLYADNAKQLRWFAA